MSTKRKYYVVDLFSGAGGFGLGFQMAGFDLQLSLEKDQWATDTLLANNSNGTHVIKADIKEYQSKNDILGACEKSPDVVIGGPPCQGFSIVRSSTRHLDDPRNTLFRNFAKWVEYLQPTMFIMENVKGILSKHDSSGVHVIEVIHRTFSDIGYATLNIWLLNSAEYGVPQFRERVFIVGHRRNIKIDPPPKTHYVNKRMRGLKKAVTVREAISDLPRINAGEGDEVQTYDREPISDYQVWARGKENTVYNHTAMKHTRRIVERFGAIAVGESVLDVSREHRERKRNGNGEISSQSYNMNNRRLHPNRPSFTIPASFYSSFIHPYLDRNLTAREAARIQSFPDYYRFMGKRTLISAQLSKKNGHAHHSYLSQYNQVGNAVPPLLSKAVAAHISAFL